MRRLLGMARLRASGPWLALAAVAVVAFSPLLLVDIPTLYDYPNRIAALHVLLRHDGDPALAANYAIRWSLQPNLAIQLLAMPLGKLFSAYAIGRIMVSLALVLPLVGTCALYRTVHGHLDYWPLLATLFLYNSILAVGALNYVIGMGLALLGFALWLGLGRRRLGLAVLVGTAVSMALYFAHLVAFAAYGLMVMLSALSQAHAARSAGTRRSLTIVLLAASQLVPAGILAITVTTRFPGSLTSYGGVRDKLVALASPTLFYAEKIDFITFAAVALGLIWLLASRRLSFARELRLSIVGLAIVAAAMPSYLNGIYAVDRRLPPLVVFLLIAATRLEPGSPTVARCVAAGLIVLLSWRLWGVAERWQTIDAQYGEYRRATVGLPAGARLLMVENRVDAGRPADLLRYAHVHLAALSVIERAAFVPSLFTYTGPVFAGKRTARIDAPATQPLSPEDLRRGAGVSEGTKLGGPIGRLGQPYYWANWPQNYDYVVWLHYGAGARGLPEAHLAPQASGSFFDIFRVVPD